MSTRTPPPNRAPSPPSSATAPGSACWPACKSTGAFAQSSIPPTSSSKPCSKPCATSPNSAAAPRPSWPPGCGRSSRTSCADQARHFGGAARRDLSREVSLEQALAESSRRLADALAAPISSPSERASRHELELRLADALSRLPADYAEIILLRNVEGLSHEEAAARMGRGVGAVRMLWVRALARLRQVMDVSSEP